MKILYQIFLITLISLLTGYSFQSVFGFVETCVIATVLQLVTPSIYQAITKNRTRILALESEINELADMSTCNVPCPCGGYIFNEIVVVSEDSITTKCPVCNGEYKLIPSVNVVLTTEPLNLGKSFKHKEVKEEEQ
mgnify:CR=1 FL=1